jgi:hypothetical protein
LSLSFFVVLMFCLSSHVYRNTNAFYNSHHYSLYKKHYFLSIENVKLVLQSNLKELFLFCIGLDIFL